MLGFVAVHGLSPVSDSRGSSLVGVHGLLILGASLVEHGLQAHGVQQLQHMGSQAWAQPCGTGPGAPRHEGSSRTRDQTCVLRIGRWVPIHCTPREVLEGEFRWRVNMP